MKITIAKTLFAVATFSFITGCGHHIKDYDTTQPKFELDTYFDGSVTAWGLVQDYTNKVTRRFCVEIEGSWQGNKGTLVETFYFNDGERSYRTWQLVKDGDNYQGTAEDVTGTATGMTQGFAFQWQYHLQLAIDGTDYEFFLDDWMYQVDQSRVFNRTSMKKFGIEVAELTLFFDKQQPVRGCQ
ncbi:DUF3833 domain-containing protein [Thalassotalea euphylliae]|uniref:DUF3833 domain-containing protein n=1 Tax=Thalassotalea euphylliae TaxID=1655234 RepID=UPI0021627DDF|nr:DUF3833 domain-containing protein [Thalassotalea euphylliae]